MGMYTGLRVIGVIKPEYRRMFSDIFEGFLEWEDFLNRDETYPEELTDFFSSPRASSIPFGALCYMPYDWDDKYIRRSFKLSTGEVSFSCSLKNYLDTIESFRDASRFFFESVSHFEVRYEEWEKSIFYELKDGYLKQK